MSKTINQKEALDVFKRIYPEIKYPRIVGTTDDESGLIVYVGDGYHVINEKVVSCFYSSLEEAKADHL